MYALGIILPLAAAPEILAGAFGATAAVVLVGGSVLLRWQRNRQQFTYMQAALEKGITQFPGTPPFWLLSLRQGVTVLSLGVALIIVGAGSWWLGHAAAQPTAEALKMAQQSPPPPPGSRPPRQVEPPEEDGPPGPFAGPPPRDRQGPFGMGGGPDRMPGPMPPRPNPSVELWEHAQTEKTLGEIALGCGVILTMLGFIRISFSKVERKYATTATEVL